MKILRKEGDPVFLYKWIDDKEEMKIVPYKSKEYYDLKRKSWKLSRKEAKELYEALLRGKKDED